MTAIHVVFTDADSGATLGEAELPIEQLPETFATETTLRLGGEAWKVIDAAPVTRAEFAASGQLRLGLRRAEPIDPKSIRFSMPTLEGVAPPTRPLEIDTVYLHEDDWRQRELIAARFAPEVETDLSEIRTIIAEPRDGAGFTRLHLRERIPAPLAGLSITLAELGLAGPRRQVAIGPAGARSAIVVGGFAFAAGSGVVYGREEDGLVVALCVDPDADLTALAATAHAHDLLLVGWCSAELLRSDGQRFA